MSENHLPAKGVGCHRTGFAKSCFEMVTKKRCQLWTRATGQHPTENRIIDTYGCGDAFEVVAKNETHRLMKATADAINNQAKAMNQLRGVIVALDNAKLEAANAIIQGIAQQIPALRALEDVEIKGRPHLNAQIAHDGKLDG